MAQGDYIQPRCQNLPNPEGLEEPRTRGFSRGRKRTKTKTSELGSGKSTYENSGWDECASTWINTKLVWPNDNGLSDRGRDAQFDGTGRSAGRPCGDAATAPRGGGGGGEARAPRPAPNPRSAAFFAGAALRGRVTFPLIMGMRPLPHGVGRGSRD